MAEKITLSVDKRKVSGRAVKQLRRDGIVPANLFGKKIKSEAIQLATDEFKKVLAKAGETSIITLQIVGEKENRPVLISAVQVHPVTGEPLHVDFHQVDLTEKVTATIPVELTGESPAAKDEGAVIVQSVDELDVEALPTELPDKLEVNISALVHIGDNLTVGDLKVDKDKIQIEAEPETVIVSAQEPQKEEELPPVPAEGEEAAAEGEAKPAEGTKEGEAAPEENAQ